LCFELTESAVMTNLNQAQRFMNDMRALGCRFALDEFGRGMASFGYARDLPLDFVKIDGLFVRGLTRDAVDAATVDAINNIAHVIGCRTIAEMVEDDATLKAVQARGVDYAQGFGVGGLIDLEEHCGIERSESTTAIA